MRVRRWIEYCNPIDVQQAERSVDAMADLKLPELNCVMIAGNLTKDPVFRKTTHGTPVANFTLAMNRRYRDSVNRWQEEVCYVGVVAWNTLAESCMNRLKRGSAVLLEGELQSHVWRTAQGITRTVVEIKARRIQFLSRAAQAESLKAEPGDTGSMHLDEYVPLDEQVFEPYDMPAPSHEKGE
jgi:single-strand DNA-binding protein